MGKLREGIQFTGTVNNLCFYVVGDRTIIRMKSNLTRKRVLKDKAFAPTRKYANNFAIACRLGSEIYKALPVDIKGRWIYRAITGEAASLLYEGKEKQQVKDMLWKKYVNDAGLEKKEIVKSTAVTKVPLSKQKRQQIRSAFLELWERQGKSRHLFKQGWGRHATGPHIPELERSAYGFQVWMQ